MIKAGDNGILHSELQYKSTFDAFCLEEDNVCISLTMSLTSSNLALGALTREWQLLIAYAFTFAGKPHPFL